MTYTLNNAGQLAIHYKTTDESTQPELGHQPDQPQLLQPGRRGLPAGSAYGQYVQMNANKYSPTDTTQIPLGYNVPVAGTPFDFRAPHTIGSRIDDVSAPDNAPAADNQLLIAQGYDHNWALNKQTRATTGPTASTWPPTPSTRSGRLLTVWTDQPGVQFYSGNFLTGTLVGISGHTYRQGAGYTFETQHFPNSPNQPNFPSTEIKAGHTSTRRRSSPSRRDLLNLTCD